MMMLIWNKMAAKCLFLVLMTVSHGFTQVHSEQSHWNRTTESRQVYKVTLSLEDPLQYISSPGFPDRYYPPNIQMMYEIKTKLDDEVTHLSTRILMTFEMFALEDSEFCSKDGFEIDDPGKQVRVYCGIQVGRAVLSESFHLNLRFFTDSEVESRGFSIRLEMYNTGCSSLFSGVLTGSFSSPYFPGRYRSHDLCVWKIEAPEGKVIRVKFDKVFDIRAHQPLCVQDYLEVGVSGDFSKNVKRLCHGTQPKAIDSLDNVMLFVFRTDCCFEGKGFNATFAVLDPVDVVTEPPPPPPEPSCPCGEENEAERIVGGKEVDPAHKYPWVVGLVDNKGSVFCGGALINTQYIITASHCLEGETTFTIRVVLGAHNSSNLPDPVPVSELIMYPTYVNRTYTNDVALLKLQEPITMSREVKPVCLPPETLNTDSDKAVIAGWGHVQFSGKGSQILKEVEVGVVTNAYCVGKYGGIILDTNICAGGEEGQDSCQGDSGGALFAKKDGKWFAVGISSWGIGCGRKDHPGVYTRVSEYRKWVDLQSNDAPPCEAISPPIQPNFKDCGVPNKKISARIVGGVETSPFEYPWMAMIVYNRTVEGVGALISPYYVLTAASVFDAWMEWYPEILDVFLGEHDLNIKEPHTQRFRVRSVVFHYLYGRPTPYNNDLALMRLVVPDTGAPPQFRPICLPRSTVLYPEGTDLTTAGWGRTSTNGPGSTVLMQVTLDVISLKKCAGIYNGWVTDKMMCAYRYGKDTCKGDSGAPLMRYYNGRYYLAGVSSWAVKDMCAAPGKPRVFSAVHRNLPWISQYADVAVA